MASQRTTSEATHLHDKVDDITERLTDNAFALGPNTTAVAQYKDQAEARAALGEGFKAKYVSRKDDEKRMYLAQEWVAQLNDKKDKKLRASYVPTDSDINILMRKDAEQELFMLESFINQHYDLNDPNQVRIVKELWPSFFEKRLEYIDEQLEIQRRIARIKLMGIQTQEDLIFIYAVASGAIVPNPKAVFDTSKTVQETQFKRGLLNMKRFAPKAFQTPYFSDGLFTGQGAIRGGSGVGWPREWTSANTANRDGTTVGPWMSQFVRPMRGPAEVREPTGSSG